MRWSINDNLSLKIREVKEVIGLQAGLGVKANSSNVH